MRSNLTESEISRETDGAYLNLIEPAWGKGGLSEGMTSLMALAPSVSPEVVTSMLAGADWRERLLGLYIAMTQPRQPAEYIEAMVHSLRDPRGLSIVPTCAALAVLARRGVFEMTESFGSAIERASFDGEVGWAIDKALHYAGIHAQDAAGDGGPNHGQAFEKHVQFYDSIHQA